MVWKRIDGRKADELREWKIKAGVLEKANGSCYLESGKTRVFTAVYGPRILHPKHFQDPNKALLRCRYRMAPFSTLERNPPKPSRRDIELGMIIRDALSPAIFLKEFPRTAIDVFIEIIQSDGGTRCAGITSAAIALANAGIPMRGLVTSVAAGKVDGKVVIDLNGYEDNFGEGDLPLAMITRTGEITLLQMDGQMTSQEFKQAIELAKQGCEKIYKLQQEALKEVYK